jgi:GrpB-like predicted nucleotidyltransferase (UPF0157 family)
MHNSLVIKKYDPQWPILFEELRVMFSELLGNMVSAIEHVGSTSVPGLAAKPIIDLDVLLALAAYLPETIRRLATLGYEHQGNLGIADREAFRAPPTLFAHHLYVCLPNCEEFRHHILLRNYLRSHPAEVSAYNNLKWGLFARFANDRAAYIQGKDDFVKQLVQRAIAQS